MYELGLGNRLQEAFVHAGYLVGLRDGAAGVTLILVVLYLLAKLVAEPRTK